MRVLGIDPGIAIVGYSVIDIVGDDYCLVTSGSIQTAKDKSDAQRLLEITSDMEEIIKMYEPDCAAIEKLFFFRNYTTIIPVAEARGIILMELEKLGVKTYEYTPLEVKQTITGYGRATKPEVAETLEKMVNKNGKVWPKLDDTVDSIAIAVCHIRHSQSDLSKYVNA